MKREELVQMREYKVAQASTEYYNKHPKADPISAFEDGVAWADEHPKNPWISVEERLPVKEKEGAFLDCFVKLADGCTAICYFFYDSQIWSPLKDCYVLFDKGMMRVTHWMPIPELKK